MSDDPTNPLESKEFQILKVMKLVLTDVVKDTATQPGLKHPLSDRTIEGIRQCLKLVAARERELVEDAGKTMGMRPHYVDEPKKNVVVPITKIGHNKKDPDKK
ncbi:segregation and condensation protein A [Sulfuricaulis sp.]|uniref:segregation and condensation protein A n=1 Tax=Sulfuricaulis sp. TaxID=2003553 RepID=UPI00355A5F06